MKTTGVAVLAFARSTCSSSWSVIVVEETLLLISSSPVRSAAGSTIVGLMQGPSVWSLRASLANADPGAATVDGSIAPGLTHRHVHLIAEAAGVEGGWASGEGAMTVHGKVGFRR
jgi:hypothetical protein